MRRFDSVDDRKQCSGGCNECPQEPAPEQVSGETVLDVVVVPEAFGSLSRKLADSSERILNLLVCTCRIVCFFLCSVESH